MLHAAEFEPHFAGFRQAGGAQAEAFAGFLDRLQGRLNWELPLTAGLSDAAAVIGDLTRALTTLRDALTQAAPSPAGAPTPPSPVTAPPLRSVVPPPAWGGAKLAGAWGARPSAAWAAQPSKGSPPPAAVLSSSLAAALDVAEAGLRRMLALQMQLPTVVDVAVVNELLILAASPAGLSDFEPVLGRLPLLKRWLDGLVATWRAFGLLHPQAAELCGEAALTVRALQGGAGGVLAATEAKDVAELRRALQLLVRALEALAPLEETRHHEEAEQRVLSADPRLDRCFRLLRQLGELPAEFHPPLLALLSELDVQLGRLRAYVFVHRGDAAEAVSRVEALDAQFRRLAQELGQQQERPDPLALMSWMQRLEALCVELHELAPRGH